MREVGGLSLEGNLWDRGRAYEETIQSACWWWPHADFIMVCERPAEIHRELVNPAIPRGWGSHRLHNDSGPAVGWKNWAIYAIHGIRVPEHVVMRPDMITLAEIDAEENAEIRRVMIERFGYERYCREAKLQLVDSCPADHAMIGLRDAKLWRRNELCLLDVLNSTPEPDGTVKRYVIPVDPDAYGGRAGRECLAATASTWRKRSDPNVLFHKTPEDYGRTTDGSQMAES
jgi:hypothetical protein